MITTRTLAKALFAALSVAILPGCSETSTEATVPASMDHAAHGAHAHHGAGQAGASAPQDDATAEELVAAKSGETLPFFDSEEFTPVWLAPGSSDLETFHSIPDFEFVNQRGQTVSDKSYEGKIYVATFFFATCPGICSRLNQRLLSVQEAILEQEDVRILSHSITPDIDTVEVLEDYAAHNGIDADTWDLVTGDRDKLYRLAKEGYFASEDLGKAEAAEDFKHTENVMLVDRNNRIRGIYNGLSRNAILNVIADIGLLQKEQPLG